MTRRFFPVAEPVLEGNEKKYVNECLDRGWISGSGEFVERFEREFAAYCGTRFAVAVANGTVALHVAAAALGIAPGDEVIVPDLTYIATANAVTYCGAKPVFCDVDARTWTLDPADVTRKITARTRAIMPVHLYGHPADMDALCEVAARHDLFIIEDAAEAHGAEYKGRRAGSLGDVATFSFYGNKIITTGEGGMLTTDDADLAGRMRLLRGQGMDPARRYWFPIVGYNYRLTNMQAAVGLAQLERIEFFIRRRREVAAWYASAMQGLPFVSPIEEAWAKNVYWLYSILLPRNLDRDSVMKRLLEDGIETRPFFHALHHMPPYRGAGCDHDFPVTTDAAARGINLPSSARLTQEDVAYIVAALRKCLD